MPPSSYLPSPRRTPLPAYVRRVAGAPEPEGALVAIPETPERAGELVVKGTCHICHDAQGPDVTPETWQPRFDTLIPSLTAVSRQRTITGFVRKVREGLQGDAGASLRGKMPRFGYLSEDEITAAYCYLLSYPPLP